MSQALFQPEPPSLPRLALRQREAAESLGISERLLLDWTQQHALPCIRIGRVVLYPVDSIREWLRSKIETDSEAFNDGPPRRHDEDELTNEVLTPVVASRSF